MARVTAIKVFEGPPLADEGVGFVGSSGCASSAGSFLGVDEY